MMGQVHSHNRPCVRSEQKAIGIRYLQNARCTRMLHNCGEPTGEGADRDAVREATTSL